MRKILFRPGYIIQNRSLHSIWESYTIYLEIGAGIVSTIKKILLLFKLFFINKN